MEKLRIASDGEADVTRLRYWSTRKKGDISEPYGETDYKDEEKFKKAFLRLKDSQDIYRMEVWKRVSVLERDPVVEEFHGNEAHLSLKNSRKEKTDGNTIGDRGRS